MGRDSNLGDGSTGRTRRASSKAVRPVRAAHGGDAGKAGARSVADVSKEKGYQVVRHRGGHSQVIGYARVSTRDQNLDAQLQELARAGCCKVYAEKCSSVGHRPGWSALMGELRKGDTLVAVRLDRIGRKLTEVVMCLDMLAGEGIFVRAIAQQIDTRSPSGRLLVPIWAAMAETERALIVERTLAGLEAARARGQNLGRPTVITRARIDLVSSLRAQKHSTRAIAEATGLGEGTVRKALQLAADLQASEPRQLRIEGA